MSANYAALIAKWATLPAATTGAEVTANLATINALTVAGPSIDVPMSAVVGYLALSMKWQALKAYAAAAPSGSIAEAVTAASELIELAGILPTFATSEPTVLAQLTALLTVLTSDANSGVVAADQTALLALAATTVPWWEASVEQGGGGLTSAVNIHDLIMAGIVSEAFAQAQGIF